MLRQIFQSETTTNVDELINELLAEMKREGPYSDKYPDLLKNLERLNEIKRDYRPTPVSRDTILQVGGTLMSIVLIVAYEQKHVMTSKAFGLIPRPK